MAITNSAGDGVRITSYALSTTSLPSQSQNTGNNQITFEDNVDVSTGNQTTGGNLSDSLYTSRLIIKNVGLPTEEIRRAASETAGTGTTIIVTLETDWNTAPDTTVTSVTANTTNATDEIEITSTTLSALGLVVGDLLTISSATGSVVNGTYEITAVNSTTDTITFGNDAGSVTADGTGIIFSVQKSFTADVFYNVDDIDNAVGQTVNLNSKSGAYEVSRKLSIGTTVGDAAGLQLTDSEYLECSDEGTGISLQVYNNAFLLVGFEIQGSSQSGAIITATNNVSGEGGENWAQVDSGGRWEIYDSVIWSQRVSLPIDFQNGTPGAQGVIKNTKIISGTDDLFLYQVLLDNVNISGRDGTNEFVRLYSSTTATNITLTNTSGTTNGNNTGSESITVRDINFVSNANFITLENDKDWFIINPTWTVTTQADLNFGSTTGSSVSDQRSVDVIVSKTDSTLIPDANVIIYEGTQLDDLVLETFTDANGEASGVFNYRFFDKSGTATATTTTYGNHAFRVDAWGYLPFVAAQTSTSKIDGTTTLNVDNNLTDAQTQAGAITAGSGITWNEQTNPGSLITFTSATGTLSVGDTVTVGSATGVVVEFVDGTGTSSDPVVFLKDRNATAIATGTTATSTSWGATTSTAASDFYEFSVFVDGNSTSYQTIYDYLAALTSQTTLSADGELIHEWGNRNQGRAFYYDGNNFSTERSGTDGVIIVNSTKGGTLEYFTSDNGDQYIPPASYTISFTGIKDGTEVRIHNSTDGSLIAGVEDVTGTGTDLFPVGSSSVSGPSNDKTFSFTYTYTVDIDVYAVFIALQYEYERLDEGVSLLATNQSFPIVQRIDRNYFNA
jgi:hypothetical protein